MNKIYERISSILGSTIVIGLFGAWLILHSLYQRGYLSFISELAILFGMLILRAESGQAERIERLLRKDIKETKKVSLKVE